MTTDDKETLQVTGGVCGCFLLCFAAVVFIVAGAIKWVVS